MISTADGQLLQKRFATGIRNDRITPSTASLAAVAVRCHAGAVDRTGIAAANVRVPHDEFLAVWRAADRDPGDWYAVAVAQTCRWMAAVPMRTALCGGLPRSPVTQRACVARVDLIEAESRDARHPERFAPALAARPGWCDGVRATFDWAWTGQGPPPLRVSAG